MISCMPFHRKRSTRSSEWRRAMCEESHETPQIRIDGTTLPLIHLRDYLGLETPGDRLSDTLLVAILGTGTQQIALHVDGILPGRDIVVKPVENTSPPRRGCLAPRSSATGPSCRFLIPWIYLPRADTETFAATAIAADRSGDAPMTSVMIVDDSVSVRRVLQNVVEHAGWSSIAARDGMDALEILSTLRRPPDVFLLDVEMPRMDGFELLRILRQEEMFAETPIIMITSRSGDKHRQQAFSCGASAYVTKPFQDEALIQTIRQQLA